MIWDDVVVWNDWRGDDGIDVWMFDLKSRTERLLITKHGHQVVNGIWKDKIIYGDESASPPSMRVYDIKSAEDLFIVSGDQIGGGAIFGNSVFYVNGFGGGDLYVYDLRTRKHQSLDLLVLSLQVPCW